MLAHIQQKPAFKLMLASGLKVSGLGNYDSTAETLLPVIRDWSCFLAKIKEATHPNHCQGFFAQNQLFTFVRTSALLILVERSANILQANLALEGKVVLAYQKLLYVLATKDFGLQVLSDKDPRSIRSTPSTVSCLQLMHQH